MKFEQLKINDLLLKNINALGFNEVTRIQENVIPEALAGNDVLVKAQTGSGKTAAYLIPIINGLLEGPRDVSTKVIILVPTRDLVNQVYDSFIALSKGAHLTCCKIMGGIDKEEQIKVVKDKPGNNKRCS